MSEERICWIDPAVSLPENGMCVLTYSPGSSDAVWLGYYIEDHVSTMTGRPTGTWFRVYGDEHRKLVVDAWASMPLGKLP